MLHDDDRPLEDAELLEEMIIALVDHPSKVRVERFGDGLDTELVVHTDPRDFGKVIGKAGRTVDAVRTLFSAVASKDGRRVSVRMADDVRSRVGKVRLVGAR